MKRIALSLIPRWRTYAGANEFTTVPMDVRWLSRARLRVERSALLGTMASFRMYVQESIDRTNWIDLIAGGVDPDTPGGETFDLELSRYWLRLRIDLAGTDVRVSCYAVGMVEHKD